jgi:hypothetical protein
MKTRFLAKLPLICAGLLAGAITANAQATRTWVSGTGDDANPCSRTAPCKTFAGAISKTAEGGEIDPLDPAGYGVVTINKAIVIDGGTGSGWASILSAGSPAGINVNITTGNHINDGVVILRNITFDGAIQSPTGAGANNGINLIKAAQLIVENCYFENLAVTGIVETLATTAVLRVNDCSFDNTGIGITVTTTSGTSAAHIDRCRFNALTGGIKTTSNAFVTVRDCYFAQTTGSNGGVLASTGCQINVENSMFARNSIGANLGGGIIRLSNNDFFDNAAGISGGTAESANNNRFRNNAIDGSTSNVIVVK